MERYADLHVHTTFSDGSFTPDEVARRARALGFAALGICDHDTVEGFPAARAAGVAHGIEVLPAIELSTKATAGQQHILGYCCDGTHPELVATLRRLRTAREDRMRLMLAKLGELGIDISTADLWALADGGAIGRPHLARLLQERGVVPTIQDAFVTLIGRDGPAFVPKLVLTAEEAIALIKAAGGVPIIAHPIHLAAPEADIERLVAAGAMGIEAYYSDNTPADTERFLAIARRANLLVTGGSDCHGTAKDQLCLGMVHLPYAEVEKLKAAAGR
ncbi:MAG TPA: PHP domain-containing protein [bacterium]|nr:PHP domain-containing protein [bacterium]